MPIYTNVPHFRTNFVKDIPDRNIYICVDSPDMQRPCGIHTFIAVQCEPSSILGLTASFIRNHRNFDIVLTYDDEILDACPNAKMYVYGTSWISETVADSIHTDIKSPKISALTGHKSQTLGHKFRHQLYVSQRTIPLPITWYRSGAPPIIREIGNNPIIDLDLLRGKLMLFSGYQYAIIIENCRQNNYFTEKLMDCLLTKTIPIYYGCPNISKWFDTTGWMILDSESVEDLVMNCSNLPNYSELSHTINLNHDRAKKYISFERNICDAIGFTCI
jgi:hypothetical protein